jgi:septal ring factor EnvC (AmiA/AmiB activator)
MSDRQAAAKSSAPAPASQRAEQKQGEFESRQREQISGPRRNEQARNTRAADTDLSRGRADKEEGAPATTAPAAPARRARGADENRAAEDSRRRDGDESSDETRTVAGRKFRRQGGAWIDTSYNAGQPFTTVRRNSEQFRALVADEPELRRIAGALGGEVTVVWKGRAYRIR